MRITSFFTGVALLLAAVGESKTKTVKYDCQSMPQICLNTCWAINCAKNVKTLNGAGFKSAKDASDASDKKRQAWGYGSKPCKKGGKWAWTAPAITGGKHKTSYNKNRAATSPEEYPYASSKQGGLKWNGKTVSLRCVPEKEQQMQGGKLSGIGTMKKSDKIVMSFDNIKRMPKKLPNWCSSRPTCKNDGHQFTAKKKSQFSKAKRDLLELGLGSANSTEIDDEALFEDAEFEDEDEELELDEGDTEGTPGMYFSPDGNFATVAARWTDEDGWVPLEDEE
ncbi:hypothetical protein ACHAQA_003259 [Verticillium albo-atrum]